MASRIPQKMLSVHVPKHRMGTHTKDMLQTTILNKFCYGTNPEIAKKKAVPYFSSSHVLL